MYGGSYSQVRITGISSNLNNNRHNANRFRKPKKPFGEFFDEEQQKEPQQREKIEQLGQNSRVDFKC